MSARYKTRSGVVAAIKRQGLFLMNFDVVGDERRGFTAHFYCAERCDVQEITDRGFLASFEPKKAAQ
jgi:hypothetical protein